MDAAKVGNFICTCRHNKNLTQNELADILGVPRKIISKYENGIILPDTYLLFELSKVFDVSIEELITGNIKSRELNKYNISKDKISVNILKIIFLIANVSLIIFLLISKINLKYLLLISSILVIINITVITIMNYHSSKKFSPSLFDNLFSININILNIKLFSWNKKYK